MNDDELRSLVRAAVSRHLGARAEESAALAAPARTAPARTADAPAHPSLAMYLTLVNPGDSCLIEPAVPCNHCGYCKTHGH